VGKILYLINVHLEAFDKATRVKQIKSLVEFVKGVKEKMPLLLVGDFNSNIDFSEAGIHELANLPEMTYAITGTKNQSQTFPSETPTERLDYIFYNQNFIEIVEAKVLNEFGTVSDHLPVMMSFRLK